jgi:eukaryotic-like serine/threonine-protein kinase
VSSTPVQGKLRGMQGTVVDKRYTLRNKLGGGGMANVYLAHDDVLDRDVALKLMREAFVDDEEFVERFRREARNAASLSHPNIAQVYDQGRADDLNYIAMEYVPGGTLKDRIREVGALDPAEAAGIAARVADALSVAHSKGIIHRDIKPQNVLLTPTGEVKVVDFGIARAASATAVTRTSHVLGTAGYMSPEQAAGQRVGPESDLYSLGVVLYEMLTGEQPFDADSAVAIAIKHLNEPPPHPRDANPEVPAELDAIVMSLLAKEPAQRYASALDLARDLDRVRGGLPPLALGAAAGAAGTTARMPSTGPSGGDTGRTRVHSAPTTSPARPRERRRRGLVPLLLLLLAVAALSGIAWALSDLGGNNDAGGGARTVEVPDVTGLTQDEAQRRLGAAGLESSVEERESSEADAGTVIEQDPSASERIRRGESVNLVVGSGPTEPETVAVPDIPYGATEEEARSQLEDVGLRLGSVGETPSDQVAAGGVVLQDPLPGVEVDRGTAVNITLSSGPPAEISQPEFSQPEPSVPDRSGGGGGNGGVQPNPVPGGNGGAGGGLGGEAQEAQEEVEEEKVKPEKD